MYVNVYIWVYNLHSSETGIEICGETGFVLCAPFLGSE